jgi:hypothetical protein
VVPEPVSDEDDERELVRSTILRCKAMADDGTAILNEVSESWGVDFNEQGIFTLVAFADQSQPWTTATAAAAASEALERALRAQNVSYFIADDVLKIYLRGLFSSAKPATITSSGRKAEFVTESDAHRSLEIETREGKPWKYHDLRAVPIFKWAVQSSDVCSVLADSMIAVRTEHAADRVPELELAALHPRAPCPP